MSAAGILARDLEAVDVVTAAGVVVCFGAVVVEFITGTIDSGDSVADIFGDLWVF